MIEGDIDIRSANRKAIHLDLRLRRRPRHERQETEQFKAFTYDELIQRDKLSLDIFWLRDESLEDSENLPAPDVLARDIVMSLESALEQFASIVEDLGEDTETDTQAAAQAAD